MGATSFENEYRGAATMQEAYRALVEDAFYSHGHDPYNGTISTTSGCMQDPLVTAPMTFVEAEAHLNGWWERDEQPQKWESAWAIPLTAESERTESYLDRMQPGWLFYGWAAC